MAKYIIQAEEGEHELIDKATPASALPKNYKFSGTPQGYFFEKGTKVPLY